MSYTTVTRRDRMAVNRTGGLCSSYSLWDRDLRMSAWGMVHIFWSPDSATDLSVSRDYDNGRWGAWNCTSPDGTSRPARPGEVGRLLRRWTAWARKEGI